MGYRKKSDVSVVVVAGQTPPPQGGQNIMIESILRELQSDTRWTTVHLAFGFTPSFKSVRKVRLGKVLELLKVHARFLQIVCRYGRPDIVLFPAGGPQKVPMIRDLLLLPLIAMLSRKVVVQFHAAGVEQSLQTFPPLWGMLMRWAYGSVREAIVMTPYNRRDPEALGIKEVQIIPHHIHDENPQRHLPEYTDKSYNVLYAGHLYAEKGTPDLVEAFGKVAGQFPQANLILMGEFLPPYSEDQCRERIRELGLEGRVRITGVLRGESKAAVFKEAHVFVFPSIAKYESFGMVMIEAMMWGLPIIATRWRGNGEVVSDCESCLVSPENLSTELSEALASLLGDRVRLEGMAQSSRSGFEKNFCLTSECHPYRDVMKLLLDEMKEA